MQVKTKFLVIGLILLVLVSLGLSAYLNNPKSKNLLTSFGSRLLVASEFPTLKVQWNKTAAEKQLKELGIFSKDEIVIPGAQYAPPTVPQEQLRHKVERLAVIIGKDKRTNVILPQNLAEINVWPSAELEDGGETLKIRIIMNEDRAFLQAITDEILNQAINSVLMAYLQQLVNGRDYDKELTFYKQRYQLGQLEPMIRVEKP